MVLLLGEPCLLDSVEDGDGETSSVLTAAALARQARWLIRHWFRRASSRSLLVVYFGGLPMTLRDDEDMASAGQTSRFRDTVDAS